MRSWMLLLALGLAACNDDSCLKKGEVGTIVSEKNSEIRQFCGRSGCTDYSIRYVKIQREDGTVCVFSTSDYYPATPAIFEPGDKLRGPH